MKNIVDKNYFAPGVLLLLTWTIVLVGSALAPVEFLANRGIFFVYTVEGLLWIVLALVTFNLGVLLANRYFSKRTNSKKDHDKEFDKQNELLTAIIAIILLAIIFGVVEYWFLSLVHDFGGFTSFLNHVYRDWHTVYKSWGLYKPFEGARMLYTGIISLGLFSGAKLLQKPVEKSIKKYKEVRSLYQLVFFLCILLFIFLALIGGQRLLFAIFIIGLITEYAIIKKNLPIKYLLIILVVTFSLWTAKEVVRVGFFDNGTTTEGIEYGANRFLFYLANDVHNTSAGISNVKTHTYGFYSFNFVLRFTMLEDDFQNNILGGDLVDVTAAREGGGTWALATPYVDFGWAGILIYPIWGFITQYFFMRSSQGEGFLLVYGLLAATIILSFHLILWASVNFWFNIAIAVVITRGNYFFKMISGKR